MVMKILLGSRHVIRYIVALHACSAFARFDTFRARALILLRDFILANDMPLPSQKFIGVGTNDIVNHSLIFGIMPLSTLFK